MRMLPMLLCLLFALHRSYAPPVTPDKPNEKDSEIKDDLENYMEYHRYLKEVVQALESDPDFRERLEKADEEDVRSGKIAEQLDFVNHNVRTKLDEIKRQELERLRHLATKQFEITNILEGDSDKGPSKDHLDHNNPHTFEIEDLKRLIKQTTADLEAADKHRREEFKEYEMKKKFEEHQKLEALEEAQKKEYMDKIKREEEAKKHHKPLHHPGSKPQLEEVWEKQDQMEQQFDPRVFFMTHDVDGNGVWDANEVKALFVKELDKIYGPNGPNKDKRERAEEMERMREHVFKENDKNRDGLIDFNEFLMETQKAEFNQDEGWKPVDENEIYTQQEYERYERNRLEELRYLQQRGLVDAHGRPLPGAHHQIQQALQQYQYQQHLQQNQVPQYHGQAPLHPQGGQAPQQYPQGGQAPQQYPQGGQAPQQYPQGGQVQQQYPQGGQVPQQYPQGGQVQQQYPQGGQVPQQYPQGGQVQQQYPQGGQIASQGQMPPQGQQAQTPQGYQQPQAQFQGQPQPPQYQGQQFQQAQAQYQGQPQSQQTQQAQNVKQEGVPVQPVNPNPASGQIQQPSQGQAAPQAPHTQAQGQAPPAQAQTQAPPANVPANH